MSKKSLERMESRHVFVTGGLLQMGEIRALYLILDDSTKGLMMKMSTQKSPVVNGLRDISMQEFWRNPLLPAETLQAKLNGIPVDVKLFHELAEEIQLIRELLLAFGSRRYGAISLLAIVDILQAVDYFLVLNDGTPDTRGNGYADDAEVIHRAFVKHEAELRAFKDWLRTQ